MYRILFLLTCFTTISMLTACQQNAIQIKEISLERWKVALVNNETKKDKIQYLEIVRYQPDGKEIEKLYYNPDKTFKARQAVVKKKGEFPSKSEYRDNQDNLLSYYIHEWKEDNLSSIKSYDASNDELLRIEEYEYDKQGKKTKKTVRDNDGKIVRTFVHKYDKNDEEIAIAVLDGSGSILFSEELRITKRDKHGNWTERWGFSNDKPVSFSARSIKYFN